jgi:chromosome segregation ATPase
LIVIAGLATYIARLPGHTQLEVLRLLEEPPLPRHHNVVSSLAFLGSAVALLMAIVRAIQGRTHVVLPKKKLVSDRDILSNVRADEAYVHVFVENIIHKSIRRELSERVGFLIRYTTKLRDQIASLRETTSTMQTLRDQVSRLYEREQLMKTVLAAAKREFLAMPEEIRALDEEARDLRAENEELTLYIKELQEKSLKNTSNLAASRQNSYAKQQHINQLKSQFRMVFNDPN